MSLAKVYRDINLIRPYAYWDYNSTEIPWGYVLAQFCLFRVYSVEKRLTMLL